MKKIVIIGAGPAGLTTAYELLKDGKGEYQVEILEETQAIGGISQLAEKSRLKRGDPTRTKKTG